MGALVRWPRCASSCSRTARDPSARMRTYVRVRGRREHPPRRPRLVLRVGRAARRPGAAGAPGHRRRGRRPRGELRGEGVRRAQSRWAAGRRGSCARTRSSSRRGSTPTSTRARPCSPSSRTRRRSSRGSRSTRRSSTCAGSSGSRATPSRSPRRLRRRIFEQVGPADHGRGRADEVPGEGGERRGEARRPARRPARPGARVPAPAAGRGALGRREGDVGEAPLARDRDRRRRSPRSASVRSSRCSARRPGATSTRSRTTATRGRCRSGGAGGRSARSGRWAAGRGRGRRSTRRSSASADRLGRRLRTARRVFRTVVLRLRFDDFTRATRSHTLPEATMHTGAILVTARGPARRRRGTRSGGAASRSRAVPDEPRGRERDPARAAARPPPRARLGARRRARALRHGRDHARRAPRPRPGLLGAPAPGLMAGGGHTGRGRGRRPRDHAPRPLARSVPDAAAGLAGRAPRARRLDSRDVEHGAPSPTETWDEFFSEFYLRAFREAERNARGRGAGARRRAAAGCPPGGDLLDVPCGFGRHALPLAAHGPAGHRRRPRAGAARRGEAPRGPRALAEVRARRLPRPADARRELRRGAQPVLVARLPRRRGGHARPGGDRPRAAPGRAAGHRDPASRPAGAALRRARLAPARRGPADARAAHVRPDLGPGADDPDADRELRRARVADVLDPRLHGDGAARDARPRGVRRDPLPRRPRGRAVRDGHAARGGARTR